MTGEAMAIDEGAPADGLRELSELPLPDTRMRYLSIREGTAVRPLEQRDRHESIADLALADSVPEQVRARYDTARSDDLEPRHALAVREVRGGLRCASTVGGLVVTAAYLPAASGMVETAIRALR